MKSINIGLIGLGTVGGGVARLIAKHHDDYVADHGVDLRIVKACARSAASAERAGIDESVFTTNWQDVVNDPDVDIVVELIGGEHPALDIFEAAFANGKHMVTANKALLGRNTDHLAKVAAQNGVSFRMEAAAAGGIPIVRVLEHEFNGNEILTVAGIMNGTTNYILSRMENEGAGYADVLADAQRLGYAEADPSADVDGLDAAHKLAILASLAFRSRVVTDDVYTQGIRAIDTEDILVAGELGCTIKLLGIARNTADGIDVRVHPTMIPNSHPLASVDGAMNAVYVVGDAVGETMFYGAGAGAFPTASAVVGDIFTIASHLARGAQPLPESEPFDRALPILPIDEHETRFYIRLLVNDEAGTLAASTRILADNNISISNIRQLDDAKDGACTLVYVTHTVKEADMRAAADALAADPSIREVASVIRIEDIDSWTQGVFEN